MKESGKINEQAGSSSDSPNTPRNQAATGQMIFSMNSG
jgi:hypothetical protein